MAKRYPLRLKCVDATSSPLTEGKVYQGVYMKRAKSYELKEHEGGWFAFRFEDVTDKDNAGENPK